MRSSEPWFVARNRWDITFIWPQDRIVELSGGFRREGLFPPFLNSTHANMKLLWTGISFPEYWLIGRFNSLRIRLEHLTSIFKGGKKKIKWLNQWELLEMQLLQAWNAKLWLEVNYSKICQKSLMPSALLSFYGVYTDVYRLQIKSYKYFVATNSHHPAVFFY